MKKTLSALALTALLFSCSNGHRENMEEKTSSAPAPNSSYSQQADTAGALTGQTLGGASGRQFVRTAEMRCKVKSVEKTTQVVENIAGRYGGFITSSNLSTQEDKSRTVRMSKDSVLEVTEHTVSSEITMRVPNTVLDTVLREISRTYTFLDYRRVSAEDVSLSLLSNKLHAQSEQQHEERMKDIYKEKAHKLKSTVEGEENVQNIEENNIDRKINQMGLMDKVQYSSVSLSLYQDPIQMKAMKADMEIDSYGPSFGQRILSSLASGWTILQGIVVFFFNLWSLILLGVLGYFAFRYWKGRRRIEVRE